MPASDVTRPSMLHLTLLMLDFTKTPRRHYNAIETLADLQPILTREYFSSGPVTLSFDSMGTFQADHPETASVVYFDPVMDSGLMTLKQVQSRLIQAFLDNDVVSLEELSHVTYNATTHMWESALHMSVIDSNNRTFDATPLLKRFEGFKLGSMQLTQIHLSSRAYIDLYNGTRVTHKEFDKLNQDGYYA